MRTYARKARVDIKELEVFELATNRRAVTTPPLPYNTAPPEFCLKICVDELRINV